MERSTIIQIGFFFILLQAFFPNYIYTVNKLLSNDPSFNVTFYTAGLSFQKFTDIFALSNSLFSYHRKRHD